MAPLSAAQPAQSFCATGVEWNASIVVAGIGNQVPAAWNGAITTSMNQWNNIPGANWQINYSSNNDNAFFQVSYRIPSGGFDGRPAFTDYKWNSSYKLYTAHIFLNPNWTWNLNGNLNQANHVVDVRTVTTHELGHELVLEHPNVGSCAGLTPAEQASVMYANYTKKWTLNSDDRAGAAYMK